MIAGACAVFLAAVIAVFDVRLRTPTLRAVFDVIASAAYPDRLRRTPMLQIDTWLTPLILRPVNRAPRN